MTITTQTAMIPQFYFPRGKPTLQLEENLLKIITAVKQIYSYRPFLTESQFLPVSKVCGVPRYLNMAFFRKLENIGKMDMRVPFSTFIEGWTSIAKSQFDDEFLFFNILKKPNHHYISPEDFLPVLEDVVLNHPGLKFLGENPMFQERYIETVICRIYYEGKCATGHMNMTQFKKCKFTKMIKNLGPNVDLNNTRDCFSYKHFYVLYCKFWVLDEDHDLIISENDLLNYNDGILSSKLTRQIMMNGRIPAFAREHQSENTLSYLDYIWFLLSETDKSTSVAIEYWFRCMDADGDGIITTYDLSEYWDEQDKKLQDIIESYSDECIQFDDLICQMNDLIQPENPGQYRLSDLRRNGVIAERFFDTFLNIEKFQIHDTYQGLIRPIQQLEREKKKMQELEEQKVMEIQRKLLSVEGAVDHLDEKQQQQQQQQTSFQQQTQFSLGAWCEYAEQEYELLLLSEQCGSVDSDWSVRNNEEEEEEEEEEEVVEAPIVPQVDEIHLREELSINTAPKKESKADDDEADEEGEIESPIQESSDDHESDSSAPSTPVMQDPPIADDNTKKWLKDDAKVIQEKEKSTNWMWHSVNHQ